MSENISRSRLVANALGCVAMAVVFLPLCFWLATSLASLSPPRPDDPDGGKAVWIYLFGMVFSGLLGVVALLSLLRSVRTLRAMPEELPLSEDRPPRRPT